jgi:hypothetical protein
VESGVWWFGGIQSLFACFFEATAEKQTAGFLEYKCVVGSRLQTKSGGSGDEWWGFDDLDSTGFGLWTAPDQDTANLLPSTATTCHRHWYTVIRQTGASLSIEPRRAC